MTIKTNLGMHSGYYRRRKGQPVVVGEPDIVFIQDDPLDEDYEIVHITVTYGFPEDEGDASCLR